MIKAIRGTRDLLPPETALWNFVEAAVRDVFRVYNFHEIRTPIFEDTQLFTRSVGEETDIVAKEMYTWHDRGGAESEQFAHLRDLLQTRLSMQVPPQHDEELLATLLDRLGITDSTLQLNSIGCPNDRAKYNDALREALAPVVGQMDPDCQRRAVTNPLRVFDCKVPEDQPIIEKLPRISQFLDEPCRKHFEQVQEILKSVGVEFQLNDRLVRGLDYYTRTAFEFTHGALGAQNAILGGGRYDGLSESLGGPSAPGIGFAIGEDRLVMALKESGETVQRKPDVYVAPLGPGMNREAARLARELRRDGVITELGD